MSNVSFIPSAYKRLVASEAEVILKNRFAEKNPVLNEGPVSLIARPRLKRIKEIGEGHIRKCFSQPGAFDEGLFVVSGTALYKVDTDFTDTLIGTISTSVTGDVSMCATGPVGDTVPAFLFIAEGGVLWVYNENSQAIGHLNASGSIVNNDVVKIDTVYYKFTSGSVDTGSPAGTIGSPYLVALGAGNAVALLNLYNAINFTGTSGTDYSSAIAGAHSTVFGYNVSANDLYVAALSYGSGGNAISTTETGANIAWGGATLAGGGTTAIRQIRLPDDVGAISVAVINSYVIVIPIQSDTLKGRFYWVRPGETTIDALDFATAERSPDAVYQVVVFGEMFWLLGQDTTEPWITTGDPDAPMERFKGVLYDRGTSNGTAIQVKDCMILTDPNGAVWEITGNATRISTPAIEERIRRGLARAALLS